MFKVNTRDFSSQMKLETTSYETNHKLLPFTAINEILKITYLCASIKIKVKVKTSLLIVPNSIDMELSLNLFDFFLAYISYS